jgi:heme exporter protein B
VSVRLVLDLARKDLMLEARTTDIFALMTMLSVTVLVAFRVAFDAGSAPVSAAAALWVATAFLASLGLARPFHAEAEAGTLDLLLASPATATDLYLAKAVAACAVAAFGVLLTLALALFLFGTALVRDPLAVAVLLALGVLGLALQASLLSAASAAARTRGALFAVLFLPLALPVILWGVAGTQAAVDGAGLSDPAVYTAAALLAVYDVFFLALNSLLARFVLQG